MKFQSIKIEIEISDDPTLAIQILVLAIFKIGNRSEERAAIRAAYSAAPSDFGTWT